MPDNGFRLRFKPFTERFTPAEAASAARQIVRDSLNRSAATLAGGMPTGSVAPRRPRRHFGRAAARARAVVRRVDPVLTRATRSESGPGTCRLRSRPRSPNSSDETAAPATYGFPWSSTWTDPGREATAEVS